MIQCENIVQDQLWQYADEQWLVYDSVRCLDLDRECSSRESRIHI
jgi:hypothetical protein